MLSTLAPAPLSAAVRREMSTTAEFKVSFGEVARTITYSDKDGALLFCFDVAPSAASPKRWTVYLGHEALTADGRARIPLSTPPERIELALERTKDYLVSCGYEVVSE